MAKKRARKVNPVTARGEWADPFQVLAFARIRESSAEYRAGVRREKLPKTMRIEMGVRVDPVKKMPDKCYLVRVDWKFSSASTKEMEKDRTRALDIRVTYDLIYEAEGAIRIRRNALKRFGILKGIEDSWPFWREFVMNCTSRMDLPKVTISENRLQDILKSLEKKP